MPADSIDRARMLIQARLVELDAEAAHLRTALQGLGGTVTSRRPGRPKNRYIGKAGPATNGSAKRRTRKAPRGQRRQQLLAAVKATPGARPTELAQQIGISANQVHSLIAKARKDKLLVKRGKGYALKG